MAGQRQTELFSKIVRRVLTGLDPCCETTRDPRRDFSSTRSVLFRTSGTPLNVGAASRRPVDLVAADRKLPYGLEDAARPARLDVRLYQVRLIGTL